MLNETYIEYLDANVDRAIYVRGSQGENVTAMSDPHGWITKMETTRRGDYYKAHKDECDENARRACALYDARSAAGISPVLAFDCSGLTIKYALDHEIVSKDYTASGIYRKLCLPVSGPATIRGQLVFRSSDGTPEGIGHMGTYIGGGKIVESRGRNYGVIRRDYNPDEWTFAGEWRDLMRACADPRPVLTSEDITPEAITTLQTALNELGFCDSDGHPLTVDGKIGRRTKEALETFLRVNIPELKITVPMTLGANWFTASAITE